MPIPDSGRSVFVALSVERLWFLHNLTDTYRKNIAKKPETPPEDIEWVDRLLDHLRVGIMADIKGQQ